MRDLLFVTRKFPPAVGGMETLSHDVWATLDAHPELRVDLVAHGRGVAALSVFVPRAALRLLRWSRQHPTGTVLVVDVLMFMLLRPVARLVGVPIATMAMGKDVVWGVPLYGRAVRAMLPHATQVLAISTATAASVVAAGVPASRIHVVRLGVQVPAPRSPQAPAALRRRLDLPSDAPVLATLGRLVPRKGVAWFIREVLPLLPAEVYYVVAGDGDDGPAVVAARQALADPSRVLILGRVSDDDRELVMAGCDIFVQSNLPTPGDMEGFGLVAVEAAMRGALTVASALEGLQDAVVDGETGVLLPPGDARAWVDGLSALVCDLEATRRAAAEFSTACRRRYSREHMASEILAVLDA